MKGKILIVDDDPHILEVLQFALSKAGYGVQSAKNGKEAFQLALSQDFALIVLDISMPEMDGLEFCREFRRKRATPIIFLSSRSVS